jgi:hypothetical protein
MNRFVDTLNRIRQRAGVEWLTPSQRRAYALLRERLEFLDAVNLWGAHGVGKTFIGWVLHAQGVAVYTPRAADIQPARLPRIVVVDNAGWQRAAVRETLHSCHAHGYDKVILITTEPVQEQVASVELQLTPDDIEQVGVNLRAAGVIPYHDAPKSLWEMVSPLPLSH